MSMSIDVHDRIHSQWGWFV